MAERDEFLTAVAAGLPFPERVRAEVIEELAGHIDDATALLERDGVPAQEAARRVLQGFGAPHALAADIARAHQTTRRLLAAAGGGAFAAALHGFRGWLLGLIYAGLASIAVAIVLSAVGRLTGLQTSIADVSDEWNGLAFAMPISLGAFAAGRAAVASAGAASRRGVHGVRAGTAVIGFAATAAFTVLVIRAPLHELSVVLLLLAPFAFVAGVYRPEWPFARLLDLRRVWIALLAVVLVTALAILAQPILTVGGGASVDSGGIYQDRFWEAMNFDIAGEQFVPDPDLMGFAPCGYSERVTGTVHVQASVPTSLRGWTDVRFEAWRGLPDSRGIDPAYRGPFAVGGAQREGDSLYGDVTVSRTPGVTYWWMVLAGTDPDGTRYVLSCPSGGKTTFNGSVWEWFTLPRELPAA